MSFQHVSDRWPNKCLEADPEMADILIEVVLKAYLRRQYFSIFLRDKDLGSWVRLL